LNSLAKVIAGRRKVLQATEALSGRRKVEQIGNLEQDIERLSRLE
jgi:hypothetical protein